MLFLYLSMLETEEERDKLTYIYENFHGIMLRKAYQYTSNSEKAEDIVHDTFLDIIRKKETIFNLPCGEMRRYIVIMVRNKSIDRLRKEEKAVLEQIDNYADTIQTDDPEIAELLINAELIECLNLALLKLDDKSRELLEMKYLQELSYFDIAGILGIKLKTVDARLLRAKKRLREILEGGSVNE